MQRLREGNLSNKMQWYHPPQGEKRTVTNIEFIASHVEIGRLYLVKKEFVKARDELLLVLNPKP